MFNYIDDKSDTTKLNRIISNEFASCIILCKFKLNQNNYNQLIEIKNRVFEICNKKLSFFQLKLSWSLITYINTILTEVFSVLHDFEKDIQINQSPIMIVDMQTVLLKKLNELINSLVE